jgi:hypothetical protein
MPRSTSRGRTLRRRQDQRESAQVVWGICAACGWRPFGYLTPFELVAGEQRSPIHIEGVSGKICWLGSMCAAPTGELKRPLPRPLRELLEAMRDALASEGIDLPTEPLQLLQYMVDHRRRRMRCPRCGAEPVYGQDTLRARWDAAKAAGQRMVAL